MALPEKVDQLDGLPDMVRDHYAKQDDGWVLTLITPDKHTGLVTTLEKERRSRLEAEKQLMETRDRFEGIDPAEVKMLRERIKTLDDLDLHDKQGLEQVINNRTATMKAEHERLMGVKEREIEKLRAQTTELDQRWRQDRIRTALLDAVTKAGVYEKAVDDAVQRGLGVFNDLDEAGNVVQKKGTNRDEIQYGKDGFTPLSPSEWITSLKASGQAPHLWPSSSGGGAPSNHGSVNGNFDWNSIENPAERLARYRAAKAGIRP